MKYIKSLNPLKRKLLKSLTNSFKNKTNDPIHNRNQIKKILISRPNHRLGNLLLISPLIQELEAIFPNCKIDLLVNQSCGAELYQTYKSIDRVLQLPRKPFKHLVDYLKVLKQMRDQQYDISINAVEESSSGKIFTILSKSKYKLVAATNSIHTNELQKEKHLAKQPIHTLREFLRELGLLVSNRPVPFLDVKLTAMELIGGKRLVQNLVKASHKPIICLFTNATGAKCYSEEWWLMFYQLIQKEFPEACIIEVLPKENISRIRFQAPTFYSTNIRELGAFIANTDVFIGADSGVMHLASASGTPTMGLFSVTSIEKYKPYNEKSIAVDTTQYHRKQLMEILQTIIHSEINTSA